MFTSRAEYRLLLDIDSADLRLTPHGRRLGLIDDARWARFQERAGRVRRYAALLTDTAIIPTAPVAAAARRTLGIALTEPTTPARLLRRSDVTFEGMEQFLAALDLPIPPVSGAAAVAPDAGAGLRERDRRAVADRMRYGGYIERQERDLERLRREETRRIPAEFDFALVAGLSGEVIEKLSRLRPASLAEAARISGITPAALSIVNVYLEKARRARTISGSDRAAPPRRTDTPSSAASRTYRAPRSLPDPE
jgi:tRNA uridine 5-carboxymethylaminomethyl modification enzyme